MTAVLDHAVEIPILLHSQQGAVLTLTLNRPDAGNALSTAMIAALQSALDSAAADAKRRVQIVEKRGASRDHPVLLGLRETRYLKCFVLRAL